MKALVLAAIALVILAACSSTGSATAAPPAPGEGLGSVSGPVSDAGNPTGDQGSGQDNGGGGSSPNQPAASPGVAPFIVYTGTMDLQVTDVRSAVDQGDQLIAGIGGHVGQSDMSKKGDQDYATVTYRIPAEQWDAGLAGLRGLGDKVLDESVKSEDVTGQVVDLDARIANAKASELALQGIMAQASSIPDVLTVQTQLTQVRGDIESMTGQRDVLANQAAYATLTVTFETAAPPQVQTVQTGWQFGQVVDDALAAIVKVGQGVVTLAVWMVIVILPIAIPLLLVLGLAVYLRRRWLRNHPRPDMTAPSTGASAM
jgi:hypothetical protein